MAAAAAAASSTSTDNILVFGATGKVATDTIDRLLETKTGKVFAFARNEGKSKWGAAVTFIRGEYTDEKQVEAAFEKVGQGARVFIITVSDPKQAKVEGAIAALAAKHKAKQILKLSANGSYTYHSADSLLRWQGEAERAIEERSGAVPWTILKPNFFYQNVLANDVGSIKGQRTIYRFSGNFGISMVDTRDIADAAAVVLAEDPAKHHGKTYSLTGPAALSNADQAAQLTEALGTEVKLVEIDDAAFYHTLLSYHIPDFYATALLRLYQYARTGGAATVQGDFKILTGKEPRTFKQFATDFRASLL